MACRRCNGDISDDAAFCQFCGAAQRLPAPPDASGRRYLRRSRVDRQVAGVCGGIARYVGADPVLIRVAWIVLTIVPGAIFLGFLAYFEVDSGFSGSFSQSFQVRSSAAS